MSWRNWYRLAAAAGAMAAPMLAGSFTPKSWMAPARPRATRTFPPRPTNAQPAAVAVHWAVGARWPPYSKGRRNWRSAEQKWELVTARAFSAAPLSTRMEASSSVWAMVEQAPYCPRKGMPKSSSPKVEEMHWLSKSPARMKSTSWGERPAFSNAKVTASFWRRASAFSQLSSWRVVSPKVWSKSPPREPSASRLPPTAPWERMVGRSNSKVRWPSRLIGNLPATATQTAPAHTPPTP